MLMKKWIKNNWNDSVWSQVFASIILFILYSIVVTFISIVQAIYMKISFSESLNSVLNLLGKKLILPIWLLLLIFLVFVALILKSKISFGKGKPASNENRKMNSKSNVQDIEKVISNSKEIDLRQGMNSSITGNIILSKEKGVFLIWAEVSDIHNIIRDDTKFQYIVSYASNGGKDMKNPLYAKYPNAWAICRVTPSQKDHLGSWKFWCNDNSIPRTNIEFKKVLNNGKHLFTIAWSKRNDYIKFFVDRDLVGENKFEFWPTDFNHSIIIGNWVDKKNDHNFNSKVGGFYFVEKEFDKRIIDNIIEEKLL